MFDPVASWATSGAMWLSRNAEGVPQCASGAPAALVAAALDDLGLLLDGAAVLAERAAIAGLRPATDRSCGTSARILQTLDGEVALSLARPDDPELVGALVGSELTGSPWIAAAQWFAEHPSASAVERAQLLGLPAAAIPGPSDPPDEQAVARGGVVPVVSTPGGRRRHRRARPLVVDLSSLWAGPLCAHLLGLRGADVIKIEGADRLDGARRGPAAFYSLLHAGHQSVTVDLRSAVGVAQLRRLMLEADLVIEASRPRAMEQLGISALDVVEQGVSWLSITAYGRTGPWSNRVGFGDDVAAAAGMVARTDTGTTFLGDALADPMTGVIAAHAAAAALREPHARLLDVSMRDVVASDLRPTPEHETRRTGTDTWEVVTASGRHVVAPPHVPARPRRTDPAALPGAHNERWLGQR